MDALGFFRPALRIRDWFPVALLCCFCLLPVLAFAAEPPPPPDDRGEEPVEVPFLRTSGWQFAGVAEGVDDFRHDEAGDQARAELIEKVRQAVGRTIGASDGTPAGDAEATRLLFAEYGFPAVELLAKQPGGLSTELSLRLAAGRRALIDEAMGRALLSVDAASHLGVGMLNSGNQRNGIGSDFDQTLFLLPRDAWAEKLAAEGLTESQMIERITRAFTAEFKAHGMDPARMGIATLNGADFFPDWFGDRSLHELRIEIDRVVDAKRRDHEAYRSDAELKQQAEGRGYDALKRHAIRVGTLEQTRDLIAELRNGWDPRQQRPIAGDAIERRVAEVEARFLAGFATGDFAASSLSEYEAIVRRHSPWTELRQRDGGIEADRLADSRRQILPNKPEVAERLSFGGAWDNWLMAELHPSSLPKYLLRSFGDGLALRRGLARGERLSNVDYDRLYARAVETGDYSRIDNLLRELYGAPLLGETQRTPVSDERLRRLRRVLDAAARVRLNSGRENKAPDADLYRDFLQPLSEADHRLYAGAEGSLERLEALRLEAARAAWAHEARALMLENIFRTVQAPVDLLTGRLAEHQAAEMRSRYPGATPEKLRLVAERTLHHGFRDLMSLEFARDLASPDAKQSAAAWARALASGDRVARIIQSVRHTGDLTTAAGLERIASEAAMARIASTPPADLARLGETDPAGFRRAFFAWASRELADRMQRGAEHYRAAREGLESGRYTVDYVAEQVLVRYRGMLSNQALDLGRAAGLVLKPGEDGRLLPQFDLEAANGKRFDGGQMVKQMLVQGHGDSALQVMLAYQQGGAATAGWVALREIAMNVPGVAQGAAVYHLLVNGEPQSAIMMGSAMMIPGMGQAYIVVSMTTATVTLVGNYYLQPLQNDLVDAAYQGFLGAEARGWLDALRATRRDDQESRRVSMLHGVDLHVIGQRQGDAEDAPTRWLTRRYTAEEAEALDFVGSSESPDYAYLVGRGLLGGDAEWDALAAEVQADPRRLFEARRASLFYHFGDAVRSFLDERQPGIEFEAQEEALPLVAEFFRQEIVEPWIEARGPFAEFDENVIISHRFTDDLRAQMARRIAGDFLWSHLLCRGDAESIEAGLRMAAQQGLMERDAFATNQALSALDDARGGEDAAECMYAAVTASELRFDELRESAPRLRIRPRVVREPRADRPGEAAEIVDFFFSLVADPQEFPPPYTVRASPKVTPLEPGREQSAARLSIELPVYDANNRLVIDPGEIELGTVAKPGDSRAPNLSLVRAADGQLEGVQVTIAGAASAASWDIFRAERAAGPWVLIKRDWFPTDSRPWVDSLPVAYAGARDWFYVAVPKDRGDVGHSPARPDSAAAGKITVALQLERPRVTAAVLTYAQSRDPAVLAAGSQLDRAGLETVTADNFTDSRSIHLRWDAPVPGGGLEGSPRLEAQIFRSLAPAGPYASHARAPADAGGYEDGATYVPGRAVYYRLRFVARTQGGAVYSDFSDVSALAPPLRARVRQSTVSGRNRYLRVDVARGQTVRFLAPLASFKPRWSSYEPFFQPHGPAGGDEASLQAYLDGERDQAIAAIDQRLARERPGTDGWHRRNAERQQVLARWDRQGFAGLKRDSPVPGAPLLGAIGHFHAVPAIGRDDVPVDQPPTASFYIGEGVDWTAPADGQVFVGLNWPLAQDAPSAQEEIEELRLEAWYAGNSPPLRSFAVLAPPEWTPQGGQPFRWDAALSLGNHRPDAVTLAAVYVAAREDGPWFPVAAFSGGGVWFADLAGPLILRDFHLREAIHARTATRLVSPRNSTLSLWWEWGPVIRLEPPAGSLPVDASGFPRPVLFGHRGETLTVDVAGDWQPFVLTNGEPHGPAGIAEPGFQTYVRDLEKLPGSARVANPQYFLGNKASFPAPNSPAGALVAEFRRQPGAADWMATRQPSGNAQGGEWHTVNRRQWSFTFPESGVLSFTANASANWTGSPQFRGSGTLHLSLSTGHGSSPVLAGWSPPAPPELAAPPLPRSVIREAATASGHPRTEGPVSTVPMAASSPAAPPAHPADPNAPPAAPATPPAPTATTGDPALAHLGREQLLATGAELWNAGRAAEAVPYLAEAVNRNPRDPDALSQLGRAYYFLGDSDNAIAAYQRLVAEQPAHPLAHAWIGENHFLQNNAAAAEVAFRRQAEVNPRSAWSYSFLGSLARQRNDDAAAVRLYRQAMEVDPNVAQQRFNNGVQQANQGRAWAAWWNFSAALEMNPGLYTAHYWMAVQYEALGQPAHAAQSYRNYLQFDAESDWAAAARTALQRLGH